MDIESTSTTRLVYAKECAKHDTFDAIYFLPHLRLVCYVYPGDLCSIESNTSQSLHSYRYLHDYSDISILILAIFADLDIRVELGSWIWMHPGNTCYFWRIQRRLYSYIESICRSLIRVGSVFDWAAEFTQIDGYLGQDRRRDTRLWVYIAYSLSSSNKKTYLVVWGSSFWYSLSQLTPRGQITPRNEIALRKKLKRTGISWYIYNVTFFFYFLMNVFP